MSIATWKKEFMLDPMPAEDVLAMLEWSLRKWQGATKKNLRRHGVRADGVDIIETKTNLGARVFNGGRCPLCEYYGHTCFGCPIVGVHGASCDHPGTAGRSPWHRAVSANARTVRPMLDLLRRAIRAEKAKVTP